MKKLFLSLTLLICLPGVLIAMKQQALFNEEPLPQKKEKQLTQYSIQYNDNTYCVSKKILEQCTLYATQKKRGRQFSKETISVLKKSASTENLSSVLGKRAKGKIKLGTPLKIVWDITKPIDQLFEISIDETLIPQKNIRTALKEEAYSKLSKKYGFKLKKLIPLLVNIATGQKDASSVDDKNKLFLITKIADLLGNNTLLQRCNPTLMEKLIGKNQLRSFVRTLTAPPGSGHKDIVDCVTHIPGTPFVVSGSCDKTLKVWNSETGLFVRTLTAPQGSEHTSTVYCVTHIPGTPFIVSGSCDKTLKKWNAETGQFVCDFTAPPGSGHTRAVNCVTHIPGTPFVVSGSDDTTLKKWNSETGHFVQDLTAPLSTLTYSEHDVMHITGTPFVFFGSADNTLEVWNFETGLLVGTLTPPHFTRTYPVDCVTHISGTPFVISGSCDKTLKKWNAETGKFVCDFTAPQGSEHTSTVLCVTHIPGTPFIVSGSCDKTLKKWNAETGLFVRTLTAPQGNGHTSRVNCVTHIPGTPFVVSGSDDTTLKKWNSETGHFVQDLTAPQGSEHKNEVFCVSHIQGTPFVVSGAADNTLKVWTINPAADMTFQHIELCWNIFTREKPLAITENSDKHKLFLSLPKNLQDKILELKKIEIAPAQSFLRRMLNKVLPTQGKKK